MSFRAGRAKTDYNDEALIKADKDQPKLSVDFALSSEEKEKNLPSVQKEEISVRPQDREAIRGDLLSAVNISTFEENITPERKNDLIQEIKDKLPQILDNNGISLNAAEREIMAKEVAADMIGFGPIEKLLGDDTISDIMVNGPSDIWVERAGRNEKVEGVAFRDKDHIQQIAVRIAAPLGRRIDEASPLLDGRLPDGSRVNIVIEPISVDGPVMSIRKSPKNAISLDTMMNNGSINQSMAAFIRIAGKCQASILVSGSTGSGKTTMLNAISSYILPTERIVTIEDAAELKFDQPHVVRLETRPSYNDLIPEVNQDHLLKNALRMRPDRIILGEARGIEAFTLLQAMNTGHDGSLATIHANTPKDALARLESLVLMSGLDYPLSVIRKNISSALDLIIHVDRMRDGVRRVTAISEVLGMEGDNIITNDLWRFEQTAYVEGVVEGRFIFTNIKPALSERFEQHGCKEELDRITKSSD